MPDCVFCDCFATTAVGRAPGGAVAEAVGATSEAVSKLRGKASDSSKRMKGVPTAGIEGRPESPSSSPEAWYNIPKPSEEGLEILGFPS